MHIGELTPLESRLVECAAEGEELDCALTGATTAELDQIDDWEERKIRAEVLVALCTGEVSDWSVHPRRGLRLRGAYVAGQVDLSLAELTQCPLAFHKCRFEEDVVLYQATTSDISFTSCALPSLIGHELNSSASLHLTKTRLRAMWLPNASIRGVVELSEVRLSNRGDTALSTSGMSASGVSLSGTHIEGATSFMGANISGPLSCGKDTRLINPGDRALYAAAMSAGQVYLNGTNIRGEANFIGESTSGTVSPR